MAGRLGGWWLVAGPRSWTTTNPALSADETRQDAKRKVTRSDIGALTGGSKSVKSIDRSIEKTGRWTNKSGYDIRYDLSARGNLPPPLPCRARRSQSTHPLWKTSHIFVGRRSSPSSVSACLLPLTVACLPLRFTALRPYGFLFVRIADYSTIAYSCSAYDRLFDLSTRFSSKRTRQHWTLVSVVHIVPTHKKKGKLHSCFLSLRSFVHKQLVLKKETGRRRRQYDDDHSLARLVRGRVCSISFLFHFHFHAWSIR